MEISDVIMDNCDNLILNANDFFGYSCADAVELYPTDLRWVSPIVDKYKFDGLNAVMSYIVDILPIEEHQTKGFKEALEELKDKKPLIYSIIDEWPTELLRREGIGKIVYGVSREEQKKRKDKL